MATAQEARRAVPDADVSGPVIGADAGDITAADAVGALSERVGLFESVNADIPGRGLFASMV